MIDNDNCRFFVYYWLNGQTFVGPNVDNDMYPNIKPETWEDFLQGQKLEELPGAYFALSGGK